MKSERTPSLRSLFLVLALTMTNGVAHAQVDSSGGYAFDYRKIQTHADTLSRTPRASEGTTSTCEITLEKHWAFDPSYSSEGGITQAYQASWAMIANRRIVTYENVTSSQCKHLIHWYREHYGAQLKFMKVNFDRNETVLIQRTDRFFETTGANPNAYEQVKQQFEQMYQQSLQRFQQIDLQVNQTQPGSSHYVERFEKLITVCKDEFSFEDADAGHEPDTYTLLWNCIMAKSPSNSVPQSRHKRHRESRNKQPKIRPQGGHWRAVWFWQPGFK